MNLMKIKTFKVNKMHNNMTYYKQIQIYKNKIFIKSWIKLIIMKSYNNCQESYNFHKIKTYPIIL